MKYLVNLLLIVISMVCALNVDAQTIDSPFSNLLKNDNVEYSYISKEMLKSLGSSTISNEYFELATPNLSSVLIIKSKDQALYNEIEKIVKQEVEKKNYIMLSTRHNKICTYTVYGLPNKKNNSGKEDNSFSSMIILEQQSGHFTTLSSFTGDFSLSDLTIR